MENELTVIIEKTSTGFSGYLKDVNGVASIGDTISELKENLQEVLEYKIEYLEEMGKDASYLKRPLSYNVDLTQFFEHYKVINKSAFAEYIGINRSLFSQYTNGLTPLSSDKMLHITEGLHKLAHDIEDIVLV
ncbi:hypothetical protein ACIVBQ_000583 [Tenacibaculum discolor]